MRQFWIELKSSLPPDQVEERGRVTTPGGRGVSSALMEVWRRLGFEDDGLFEAGDHGWELFAKKGKLQTCTQVTWFGDQDYLIGVEQCSFFLVAISKRRFIREVLVPLDQALRDDPRVLKIGWVGPDEAWSDKTVDSPADPGLLTRYGLKL